MRTILIRFVDQDGDIARMRGQISEPACNDGWHAVFEDADSFWLLLRERLTHEPAPTSMRADRQKSPTKKESLK